MIEERRDSISLLQGVESEKSQFLRMSAVSAACHLVLLMVLLFSPDFTSSRRWSSSVTNVSLVALPYPGKGPAPRPRAVKEAPSPAEKKAAKPVPEPKAPPEELMPKPETVSLAKKNVIQPKTSLKKKTFKADNAIKSAIQEIKEKADQTPPDALTKALAELKEKVDDGPTETGTGIGTGGGGEGGGKTTLDQMDIYKVEIASLIQKNWAFSEPMVGGKKNLEARLVIKIHPEGQIIDMFFETKSGNSYFDDSAFKAIKKSDPLPPLPRGYRKPFYMVGLRFTPSGLN